MLKLLQDTCTFQFIGLNHCIHKECNMLSPSGDPTEPKLSEFMNDVASQMPANWRKLGIQLGLSLNILDGFQANNSGKPDSNNANFESVFNAWKKKDRCKPFTWKTMYDILKLDAVGEACLAEQIENKYSIRGT